MKNIILAIKLMVFFFLITTLTLFFVRLSIASIFMIKMDSLFLNGEKIYSIRYKGVPLLVWF